MTAAVKLNLVKQILDADEAIFDDLEEADIDLEFMVEALKESVNKQETDISEFSTETCSEASPIEKEGNSDGQWEEIKGHENYEINTAFPYRIRKKGHYRVIKEFRNHKHGYIGVHLEHNKTFNKHVIIAQQWLPNPKGYKETDHINRITSDNHLSNLRWVSRSENNLNRGGYGRHKYEYVSSLPEGSIEVKQCNKMKFTGLYYHEGTFLFKVGNAYRKLIQLGNSTCKRIYVKDSSGKHRGLSINIFNRELSCGAISKD
jgi:hypothetical protein